MSKQAKNLLIFDLNGVLGYMTKEFKTIGSGGIYTQEVHPEFLDSKVAIYNRPFLEKMTLDVLIRKKKLYDVGVWSSADYNDTKLMVDKLFGRYFTQLLFVTYTKRDGTEQSIELQTDSSVKPMAIQRNFSNIWAKYSQYNESNTFMVSNFYNQLDDFQRNDIVIPMFDPKIGKTDFLDDKYMSWTFNYLNMLASLETTVGPDIRQQMEALSMDLYLKRATKQINYNSYKYDPNNEF